MDEFKNSADRYPSQFIDTMDNWLFGDRPILLERYLHNGFGFHLQIRLRLSEFDTQDFCAVFSGPDRPLGFRQTDKLNCAISLATELISRMPASAIMTLSS